MNDGKFIVCGYDKKNLRRVKNALSATGFTYIGYLKEKEKILRNVRGCMPDLLLIDVDNNFNEIEEIINIIDEDLLTACILIIENLNDKICAYLNNKKIVTYICKPIYDEIIVQIAGLSIINFNRVISYEKKMQKLNESMQSRKVVERAKWILVEKNKISENEAYEIIKMKSRNNRIPMKIIAEAMIDLFGTKE